MRKREFAQSGFLGKVDHNCKAQAANKQKWIRFLFHRLSSKRRKTPFKAGKGGRDLNEVFTLFFSLGAISYSEWPFSAITPVHPSVVLFSLQMLPEPKMATTQTRFPA